MMRLITIDGQITFEQGNKCFAFYDTVRDKFVSVGDDQTWESVQDLERSFHYDQQTEQNQKLRERLVSLAKSNGY